jgi:hypothetical protein
VGKVVPSLQSVKIDISNVLTIISGLDPHMIIKHEDGD